MLEMIRKEKNLQYLKNEKKNARLKKQKSYLS